MIHKITRIIFLLILAVLTIEILIRRFLFHQIPSQLNREIIYLIVGINSVVLFWFLWNGVKKAFQTKKGKN